MMNKQQIFEIKNRYTGEVLFSYELQEGQESGLIALHAVEAAVASGANLRGANLHDANLECAELEGAKLQDANLEGAKFQGAKLRGANLQGADLQDADFEDADLEDADLEDAKLLCVDFRGTDLQGAKLQGADFQYAIGDMEYIKSMQFDTWHITYTSTHLSIGCQLHPIDDWKDWKNKSGWISTMSGSASDWAEKYLDLVLQIIDLSPAKPANGELKMQHDELVKLKTKLGE